MREANDAPSVVHDGLVLIVNADDYGLTAGTNRGIEHAHRAGVVTSTNVMVNQVASGEVGDLRRRCPELGVGLHLTLTLGESACAPARVRSLTDGEGRLLPRSELLRRLRTGGVAADEVARECLTQLQRLRSVGIEPDHWSVHQHIHEYLPLGVWVAGAMADAGVRVARSPLRLLVGAKGSPKRILTLLRARGRRAGWKATTALHRTPDALLEAHPERWAALAPSLPAGVIEAVCHPGESEAGVTDLTPAMGPRRVDELQALLAPDLRRALATRGATLATFAAVFAG